MSDRLKLRLMDGRERVAAALWEHDHPRSTERKWNETMPVTRELWLAKADAAIAVLSEALALPDARLSNQEKP